MLKTPYNIDIPMDISEHERGVNFLTDDELKIFLGEEYFSAGDRIDLFAMKEASQSGPGLANAYVLGANYSRNYNEHIEIPVSYFTISKKTHWDLGIDESLPTFQKIIKSLRNS